MAKIIGIDFGTTNSVVAVMQGNAPIIIKNEDGQAATPSFVTLASDSKRIVGSKAQQQATENPSRTVSSVKRLIGLRHSEMLNKGIETAPHTARSNENDIILLNIEGREYTPQELAATILKKIKKTAETFLGEPVTEAVLTVPALFNDTQRRALKEAGEIAGLKIQAMISETAAAALAYGFDKTDEYQTIAVYRLGGGTFDISILELGDGIFEAKATDGDTHLGGDDLDFVIVNRLLETFTKQENFDLRQNATALQRLKSAAEKAKIELSTQTVTEINLPNIATINGVSKNLLLKITRAEFEQLIDNLIQRTLTHCSNALKNGRFETNDITEVILVGGATRIPKVQQAVAQFFGKQPIALNTGEVGVLGAAIKGGVLSGEIESDKFIVLDALPTAISTIENSNFKTTFINANTTIPTRKSMMLSTSVNNQSSLEIPLTQGNSQQDYHTIGLFIITGILPEERGVPQIEINLEIDSKGIMNFTASDNGRDYRVTARNYAALSYTEIAQMQTALNAIEV